MRLRMKRVESSAAWWPDWSGEAGVPAKWHWPSTRGVWKLLPTAVPRGIRTDPFGAYLGIRQAPLSHGGRVG